MSMVNELVAGDSLNFITSVPDYIASDGWVLHHRLISRAGGPSILLSSQADGVDPAKHRTQQTAAETAAWSPGPYDWVSYVLKGAERYTVSHGELVIRPDSATAPSFDLDATVPPAAATLEQARAMVAKYLAAEAAALDGIEVRLHVGSESGSDRLWRSAEVQQIRAGRVEWERRVAQLQLGATNVPTIGGLTFGLASFNDEYSSRL